MIDIEMLDIGQDRRDGQRVSLTRPCKVFEPRARKYVAGTTCNVGTDGMLLRLDRALPLEPGDRLYVAIAQKRRQALLRSDEMFAVRVIRMMSITSGEVAVAVRFADPVHEVFHLHLAA